MNYHQKREIVVWRKMISSTVVVQKMHLRYFFSYELELILCIGLVKKKKTNIRIIKIPSAFSYKTFTNYPTPDTGCPANYDTAYSLTMSIIAL